MGKSFLSGNRMEFWFLRGKIKKTQLLTEETARDVGEEVSHFEGSKVHQVKKAGNRLEGIKKNLRAEYLPTS